MADTGQADNWIGGEMDKLQTYLPQNLLGNHINTETALSIINIAHQNANMQYASPAIILVKSEGCITQKNLVHISKNL